MIAGPALCLFFAALKSNAASPSVPLPTKSSKGPVLLSAKTCPPSFSNFFALWASCVPGIQALTTSQHVPDVHPSTTRLAADLRAVAIEISQRRSFQNRYGADLQAVLDANPASSGKGTGRAKFVPPPSYYEDDEDKVPPISESVRRSTPSGSRSPSILNEDDPTIDFIPRAYFAAVSLAVVEVSTTAVTPAGDVEGVLGQYILYDECPDPLKPLMRELAGIAARVKEVEVEDDKRAMDLIAQGRDEELAASVTRMERLQAMLRRGVGVEGRSMSPNGTTIQLANKINGLALRLVQLPAFMERQNDVFGIVSGAR
ncbi:uncharacterized protein EI90DRAFT_3038356 [Cantharellus anzutake]|uniref:uncharacterized protein n=1 Tax=Cantharellus anzutake TaxID=1750568 RepID=UPI0019086CB6|nr:uncharacterized protein EI90DRAFT_3038356 [Cantharellus anzutake]KAF8339923.1 hypothetical protein EI90DRAFT_3038356 [Cantharellus anzutake]